MTSSRNNVRVIRPLEVAANKAWWDANVTGKPEAFEKKEAAENKVDQALSNADTFKKLKALHTAKNKIDNEITARTIDVLYLQYLAKQVDPKLLAKITAKANAVEQKFNVYRAKVGGKELTDSEVRSILKTSKVSKLRQEAWESSKGVGQDVEADLKELVKLRNQMATELGFKNYHVLMLYLNEQDGPALMQLFDELDTLTREPFMAAKKEIDSRLATMYNVGVDELRPWHYHDPFFQEPPSVFDVSLDEPYAAVDIPAVCAKFYKGIGLPVDDVLARSRLVRTEREVAPRLLHRHRQGRGRSDFDQHCPQRVLDGNDASRTWAFGLQQQKHPAIAPLPHPRCVAHPHHRGRGDAV